VEHLASPAITTATVIAISVTTVTTAAISIAAAAGVRYSFWNQ
jgi:hypothetical protein